MQKRKINILDIYIISCQTFYMMIYVCKPKLYSEILKENRRRRRQRNKQATQKGVIMLQFKLSKFRIKTTTTTTLLKLLIEKKNKN